MAAIHFRGFIFFSALIPTVIYTVVAAILVWVLSTRIQADQIHLLWILLSCIAFSAVFKMGKDAPLLIKNAIDSNKFHVTNEDRPLLDKFRGKPITIDLGFHSNFILGLISIALLSSVAISGVAWSFSELFKTSQWQVYILAVTILPLTLFISLFVINVKTYISIESGFQLSQSGSLDQSIRNWFILPEAFSFLVVNLSILLPLYSISLQSLDNQVVTISIVSLVTTAFLFLSINADVKSHVSGLIQYNKQKYIGHSAQLLDLASIEKGPKAYQIKHFSYWKWMPAILAFQLMLFATSKYVFIDQWFHVFVFLIEIFWLVLFSIMRFSVVLDTYRKIIYFRFPDSLEEKQQYRGVEPYDV